MQDFLPSANFSRLQLGEIGFIDHLHATDKDLFVSGWAVSIEGPSCEMPKRIFVSSGPYEIASSSLTIDRPDVVASLALSEQMTQCGFEIRFSNPEIKIEPHAVGVFAELQDGRTIQLRKPNQRFLQMELTGKCNFRCPMCPSVSYSEFHNKDLKPEDLALLQPLINSIDVMCFDGFGEPFTSRFFESYLTAIPKSKELLFHSNGFLLSEKHWDVLLKNSPPLRYISFSLDTLNAELYPKLRVGGNIQKVKENIEAFKQYRDSKGQSLPKIKINLTLIKDNYHEIPDFIRYAKELDSMVELNYLYDPTNLNESVEVKNETKGIEFNYEKQKPKYFSRELNKVIDQSLVLAKELGVQVFNSGSVLEQLNEVPDEFGFGGKLEPIATCPCVHGNHNMMMADGRFHLCVYQTQAVFDWRKTNNVEPTKDPRVQEMARLMRENIIPKECGGAGCRYVGRRPSTEKDLKNFDATLSQMAGGWSGKNVKAENIEPEL